MYGYIYKTVNLINGKIYIGQKRSNVFLHNKYLGSGVILKKAISKYGVENFKVELLEECETFDSLNEREIYWIDFYNSRSREIGYNVAKGGSNLNEYIRKKLSISGIKRIPPMLGKHHSEKSKKKMSNSMKGKNGYWKGKHIPEEMKQNMSKSMKGRTAWNKGIPMSEEQKQKLRGRKVIYNTKTGRHPFYGKKFSEEHKRHMSESKQYLSDPTLNPMYGKKGLDNPNFGKKSINNGFINKRVKPKELQYYLDNGWKLGQIKKEQRSSNG